MEDEDDFEQQSLDFLSWFRNIPGAHISPKIKLADLRSAGHGRGVVAVEDIEQDEELFSIPHSAILSTHTSELLQHIKADLVDLEPWLRTVLALIYEYGKGRSSRWWPYLRILPKELNTLIFWSHQELAELQGSTVVNKIGKKDAEKTFEDILLPIIKNHAGLFTPLVSTIDSPLSKDTLLPLANHMASLVMAYAFDLESSPSEYPTRDGYFSDEEDSIPKGMVPLADMLNGSADNDAQLQHGDENLTMVASYPIKKGKEIYIDNGAAPRSDLLRRYGYISEEHIQYDVVEIHTNKIREVISIKYGIPIEKLRQREEDEWSSVLKRMRKTLKNVDEYDSDLFEESYDLPANASLGGFLFEPAFILTIKALIGDEEDMKHFRTSESVNLAADLYLNHMLTEVLREIIISRKNDYSTTIAEDEVILKTTGLSTRLRQAVEIRRMEKWILASATFFLDSLIRETGGNIDTGDAMVLDDAGSECSTRPTKKQRT